MNKRKVSKTFHIASPFSVQEWPPMTAEGWEKEYRLRVQPNVRFLVHHHPFTLIEIIRRLISEGGKQVEEEVVAMLVEDLEFTMKMPLKQFLKFKPKTVTEQMFCLTMVYDINRLTKVHPFVLFKIIVKLIDNDKFTKITSEDVRKKIQSVTKANSDIRASIRKKTKTQ